MGTLMKARRIDLINLREECRIELSVKTTFAVPIKVIKNSEEYNEDFTPGPLEVIMAARTRSRKKR